MANALARPTINRAVHLRITPRLCSAGEAREVMRLMSQFGEIEYFKSLRHIIPNPMPNSAIVIFRDASMANECVRQSPIRFRMGRAKPLAQADEPIGQQPKSTTRITTTTLTPKPSSSDEPRLPRGPLGTPFGLGPTTRALHTSVRNSSQVETYTPLVFTPPSESTPDVEEDGIFQIQTRLAERHFRDRLSVGPYYGNYEIDSKAVGQYDLAKRVPLLGLSCVDWRAKDRPWRVLQREIMADWDPSLGRRKTLQEIWDEVELAERTPEELAQSQLGDSQNGMTFRPMA